MGPALVLVVGGAAVVSVKKALDWFFNDQEKNGHTVPQAVVDAVLALREGKATATVLLAAAAQAEACGAAGAPKLAAVLRRQAAALKHAEQAAVAALALEGPEPETYASPLAGVDDDAWTCYVRRMRIARPDAVSPSYCLGAYGLSAAELGDVGLMTDVHKGEYQGRKGVYLGTWREGCTQEEFLAAPERQYDVLAQLTQLHACRAVIERACSCVS